MTLQTAVRKLLLFFSCETQNLVAAPELQVGEADPWGEGKGGGPVPGLLVAGNWNLVDWLTNAGC